MESLPKNSKLILKGIVGSHSFNLASEGSDLDVKGVYIQANEDILSDGHVDFVQVNKDECYFELRKFLKLLAVANPNALELLYLPNHCILEAAEEFQYLTKIRDTFLTKRCYDTFYHYARTQLRKSQGLNKKRNWEKSRTERKTIHDFCKILIRINGNVFSLKEHILDQGALGLVSVDGFKDTYKVYVGNNFKGVGDENTNEPRLSEIPKGEINNWLGIMTFNREAYSTHCKEYAEYQKWLKERNPARWKTNKKHGQVFDSKNLMNLVRLIISAERIVKNGTLNIDMTDHRDLLLGIKNGTVDLEVTKDEWLKRADNLKELFAKSDLPDRFEEERLREIELQLRNYKKQHGKSKIFFRR